MKEIIITNGKVYELLLAGGYVVEYVEGWRFRTDAPLVVGEDLKVEGVTLRLSTNGMVFPVATRQDLEDLGYLNG